MLSHFARLGLVGPAPGRPLSATSRLAAPLAPTISPNAMMTPFVSVRTMASASSMYGQKFGQSPMAGAFRPLLAAGATTIGFYSIAAITSRFGRAVAAKKQLSGRPAVKRPIIFGLDASTLAFLTVQTGIFASWTTQRNMNTMYRLFTYNTARPTFTSSLLSTVSHATPLHFGFNSFAFYSLSRIPFFWNDRSFFFATLLSGSAVATAITGAYSTLTRSPVSLLGLSGGLYALFSYYVMRDPDARFGIIFLPGISLRGPEMLLLASAFEIAGVLKLFRSSISHTSHLGGMLFGLLAFYGITPIWERRDRFLGPINRLIDQVAFKLA
ncbi:hypothetical protein H696_04642 [Fonticula alba]|uniref:Peptidase S54 rhomboid domain-containing protein n=1 Tax=Fonticula alba TaxID=691883 RepID=A0A058Z4M7_FONAL|nr:hypothetical protein H696_04642 [Fonticula alba]KCV69225.1 hypothetical protein H696_04642 [Fonticula alba]|eukprot:XP_009496796.1 hypothetical protein H696_04642 [Fonticula alba]